MYRLVSIQNGEKVYLHANKEKREYEWYSSYVLTYKNTSGRAKKFILKEAAQEFIEWIIEAKAYFNKLDRTEYEFKDSRNNVFIIPEFITRHSWSIETIHDDKKLTHDELCKIGCTFLREQGCSVVVNQPNALPNGESPDAIGFHGHNQSHIVEAKTSRSDFLADKNKPFRTNPKFGAGSYRWFICEPDLIIAGELPDNWGLVYAIKGQRKIIKEANPQENNILAELYLLYNIARRGIGGREST
jgi:hypothetical protein